MTNTRPKLLWHSNAPFAATGYGAQTALFAPRLAERYDLALSAFYGLCGGRIQWGGIPIYPGLPTTYGNEVIAGHARDHFGGDVAGGLVVTLLDVWVLNPLMWRQFNLGCWVPVDHEPMPPMVARFFDNSGAVPIAMSRFGERMLAEFDPLYCPHAVDTQVYRPHDRREARKATGLPRDAFVVGVVAANKGQPSRKSFPEILQAFAAFRQRHDDALLYLHTEVAGAHEGVDIASLAIGLGIPQESVIFTDQYRVQHNPLPPELMARLYSSMDVLLNPARGEGFGIPVLEAAACGTPAVVTDFSAMSEVGKVGWQVPGEPEWTSQMSWQRRPRLDGILHALEECYALSNKQRERMGQDARRHARGYDLGRVVDEHMLPALEALAERTGDRSRAELVEAAA